MRHCGNQRDQSGEKLTDQRVKAILARRLEFGLTRFFTRPRSLPAPVFAGNLQACPPIFQWGYGMASELAFKFVSAPCYRSRRVHDAGRRLCRASICTGHILGGMFRAWRRRRPMPLLQRRYWKSVRSRSQRPLTATTMNDRTNLNKWPRTRPFNPPPPPAPSRPDTPQTPAPAGPPRQCA